MRRLFGAALCVAAMIGCAEETATVGPDAATNADAGAATTGDNTATTSGGAATDSEATTDSEVVSDTAEKVVVIDVRTKAEFDSGHVEGALHIPHDEIADRIAEHVPDKTHKIAMY